MKLYYATGTCSFAPHVALREAKIPFDLVRYDMKSRQLDGGGSLEAVNDKGYVPVLELEDGRRLTEVSVILQYVADLSPQSGLAPVAGSFERYRHLEWLNFIATEIHKAYWPLFHDGAEIENTNAKERLTKRFGWVQSKLGAQPFLMGESFMAADAYLLTVLNWTRPAGIDMGQWPRLKEYWSGLRKRPSVVEALAAESPLKKA